jgi:hypothetical protein
MSSAISATKVRLKRIATSSRTERIVKNRRPLAALRAARTAAVPVFRRRGTGAAAIATGLVTRDCDSWRKRDRGDAQSTEEQGEKSDQSAFEHHGSPSKSVS